MLNTENRFICITRPRRFGKTAAANLIVSFFPGYDSRELFSGLKIKKSDLRNTSINIMLYLLILAKRRIRVKIIILI
ncbi:MAG: AAA family ATPase [Blautia marasmi]